MALDFKSPADVADEYLTNLKLLKPEINKDQTDSDWWIKAQVIGGTLSGVYQDQKKISNDAFPQSGRHEALQSFLAMYFTGTQAVFQPSTPSQGPVQFSGTIGTVLPAGTQFLYQPNGNVYQAIDNYTVGGGGTGIAIVRSVSVGQSQNLLQGASLTLSSPPAGINATATVFGDDLKDGRDPETDAQAADRILTRLRTPLAGGKVSDYILFALAADPSVVTANVIRFPNGFGTVEVVITAGTTDIDFALDNNQPVVLTPSDELVAEVQAFIETQKPVTDCVFVAGPNSVVQNVTVRVRYLQGHNSTIPTNQIPGQTLTQAQMVQREVKRAMFKTPPGGRQLGGSGFLVASEIEEVVDNGLSAEPYITGRFAILLDRQVDNLSATGPNRLMLGNELIIPGTITVVEM